MGSPHLAHICAGTARQGLTPAAPPLARRRRVVTACERSGKRDLPRRAPCTLGTLVSTLSRLVSTLSTLVRTPSTLCSGNVICLDVLRAIKREPASAAGEYSEYPAVSTRSSPAVSTLPRMHVCT